MIFMYIMYMWVSVVYSELLCLVSAPPQGHCQWTSPLMAALESPTCVVVGLTALPGVADGLLTSHVCLMEPVR